MTPSPLLLGLKDASLLLGISFWTLRRLIKIGKLAAVRFGRRVLIARSDLDRLIEENRGRASDES